MKEIFAAQQAFFRTGKTLPVKERKKILRRLYQQLKHFEPEMFKAAAKDLGRSDAATFMMEVALIKAELRYILRQLHIWTKPERRMHPLLHFPGKSSVRPEPLGTVLVMAPWNYPFQLSLMPLAAAIAAGNTVIVKPSEMAPASAEVIEKFCRETFSPEWVCCITGGPETAADLTNLKFDLIFFTGGTETGRKVYQAAAVNLVPVVLELGGKNPCIVSNAANIKASARRIAWGKFMNAGQTCLASDMVYVHASVKDKFIRHLQKNIQEFFGNDPLQSEDYAKIIHEKHFNRVLKLIEEAGGGEETAGNRKQVAGKKTDIISGGRSDRNSLKIEPTLISADSPELIKEEIFGPVMPVITYTDFEELCRKLRDEPKALASYIFTENKKEENYFRDTVPSGCISVNETVVHFANLHLPFGGIGNSGTGQAHGEYSFRAFSQMRPYFKRYSWLDVPVKNPPFTKGKMRLLRWMMKKFM